MAVAQPFHRERDVLGRVAGPEEVAVHRVDRTPWLDRATRRHHGLPQHLPTEHAPVRLRLARAGEDVLSSVVRAVGCQVQHSQQPVEQLSRLPGVVVHPSSDPGSAEPPSDEL
jgi:hypothetical protein